MTAPKAIEKIQSGKSEFVVSEYGYGLRRKINNGPLAGSFTTDTVTERTRKVLQKRGFQPREMFSF